MKIQIGQLTFSNKATALAHFSHMLHRYGLGNVVDDVDAQHLLWLL